MLKNIKNPSVFPQRGLKDDCKFINSYSHSDSELKVIRLEDAAVPEPAGLTAGREQDKAGTLVGIDSYGDALLTQYDVAVARCNIPDPPRNPLIDHRPLTIDHFGSHPAPLRHAAKLT